MINMIKDDLGEEYVFYSIPDITTYELSWILLLFITMLHKGVAKEFKLLTPEVQRHFYKKRSFKEETQRNENIFK